MMEEIGKWITSSKTLYSQKYYPIALGELLSTGLTVHCQQGVLIFVAQFLMHFIKFYWLWKLATQKEKKKKRKQTMQQQRKDCTKQTKSINHYPLFRCLTQAMWKEILIPGKIHKPHLCNCFSVLSIQRKQRAKSAHQPDKKRHQAELPSYSLRRSDRPLHIPIGLTTQAAAEPHTASDC